MLKHAKSYLRKKNNFVFDYKIDDLKYQKALKKLKIWGFMLIIGFPFI